MILSKTIRLAKNTTGSEKRKDGDPVRILVVDDDKDIAEVIKRGLERAAGFDVDVKYDPVGTLSEYLEGQYDLLLLDINMPKMNGFELYSKIREIDPKVKICFISAFEIYFDEFQRLFPKLRVDCFVRKPVSMAELSRVIAEELGMPELIARKPRESS